MEKTELVERVAFWTTGENMTRIMRDFWEEGSLVKAMEVANDGMNMNNDLALKLFIGEMCLVGDTREGDHTLNLQKDESNYKGRSIESFFNSFKNKYIQLYLDKIDYDFNLRKNMIRSLSDGIYEDITDVEREVRGVGLNLEKKKLEYLKQLSFICNISSHDFNEIEKELELKMNEYKFDVIDDIKPKVNVSKWIKNRIKVENEPLKMGEAGDSDHGWVSPKGKFYICGYMEHIMTAEKIAEDGIVNTNGTEKALEDLGWLKISNNQMFMFEKRMTHKMRNFIIDHWVEKELKYLELNGTTFNNLDDLNEYFDYTYGRF